MRGARWLLLLAMVAIVGAVGFTYRAQKKILREQAPAKPQSLPPGLNFSAEQYHLRKSGNNGTLFEITAKDFKQVKDSSRVDLTGVELKLFKKTGDAYDLIKSAAAAFYAGENRLYSDGDVEITLAVPAEGEPPSSLVSIRTSGVNLDTNTGKAETDRPSSFTFRNGNGKSTGAYYDPTTHELQMKKDVEVLWKGTNPQARPMKIEASSLTYHEATSEIWLKPWGRLTRDHTVVEGYESIVRLQDQAIRRIESNRAHGSDEYPDRKLQYAADGLWVDFDDEGEVRKISGQGNTRLVSTSAAAETTITASRVDMDFEDSEGGSTLGRVNTMGDSTVTSKPLPAAGRAPAETHILRSDVIELKMRPGGREIETVQTHAPGRLEFLPNQPAQHHRTLDGKDLVIAYGASNRIDSLRVTEAKTQTDPTPEERKRNQTATRTASKEMLARFQPNSSQVSSIEQWGDFTYDEGDRRARAAKATLNSEENVMLLENTARVWDASGSTSADHIRLDQRTGNFTAEGGVKSSRLPEKGQKNPGMLSGDDPLQAQARKMESSNRNRTVHYEGDVHLWQGANRIEANTVDVDREKQTLTADGGVITNLWEQPKDEKKKPGAPVLTVVHAAHLVYTDQDRLAVYTGGTLLNRPALQVKARELRSYLADSSADSRLQKAMADGAVEIVDTAGGRSRTGTAEHGEYYPDEQKVILRGGQPQMVDSLKGATKGNELTYFANDDRLLVNGSADQPVKTRIRRK
ncbi:MAG: LPS export ABC transporter periplasmic protein LptC [Terriglobia bacterium]|nr:MAG: LPS export ABC transporter periplasmic protein LptC [Terriglobia bacterium]